MTELIVFIIVGGAAVAFAVTMLLSDNAVHSALSLIVTMVCIAVLFLALNAPFLAMIQITVYAGAIMVLFLFVIMLLGAEKLIPTSPGEGARHYRWFAPLALTLTMSLLLAGGLTILQSQAGDGDTQGPNPILRVVNLTRDGAVVSATANGINVADDVIGRGSSGYIELAPGDTDVIVTSEDGTTQTVSANIARGTAHSILVYGAGVVALVPDDLSPVLQDRSGRFVVYNGYDEPVSLVDFGSDLIEDDSRVVIADIAPGTASAPITLRDDVNINWRIVTTADPTESLYPLAETEVERDRSTLIVVGEEAALGETRPTALIVTTEARPAFGSPRAIGYSLFTDFLLPFQMLALLLLAAMVGVIVMTHRPSTKHIPTSADRRRVSRPLVNVIASQVGHEVTQTDAEAEAARVALLQAEAPEVVGK
ncbi:MAG: NADH-quinone oxidoreductase subunit J [Chloroflexota bacterium]|nr:NADH-quinone oxidoreductase subunit J [Chloroflexota bacterium]